MGGMKSGTGDVWGNDDDEEEVEREAASESDADAGASSPSESDEQGRVTDAESSERAEAAGFGGSQAAAAASEATSENDIAKSDSSGGGSGEDHADGRTQPYVVRRMLKDKSVQFERDERLTFFVHDDVKSGEQELEAEAQELFGRDIPVFDIREAVYRAALQNRDDVVDELEGMGYARD